MEDRLRAKRTGPQWCARIEAYLNLRADFYLALGRFDQNRIDYLDAVKLVRESEYRALPENTGLHIVLPPATPVRKIPERERALAANLPVKSLVARLQELDPTLMMTKTLRHLSKEKLARMIYEREFAREAADTWSEVRA